MRKSGVFVLAVVCGLWSVVSSCKYSGGYQTINANNKFSISVPSWMKEDKELKPGADFQYANRFRNFYAIAVVENKNISEDSLASNIIRNLDVLRKAMKNPVVSDSVEVNVGGLKGVRVEVFGKMNEENIYFSEEILEGESKYYHISVWTRGEDRKLRYKEDISRILNSFKEI